MSRLDEMIPENEDKLAWLLGVPRGACFKYHDKVYKADDIILQAMWTADGEFYFEEIEQRAAFDIIQHSNEIETPLLWDAVIIVCTAQKERSTFANHMATFARLSGRMNYFQNCL